MEDSGVYQEESVLPHGSAYIIVGSLYCSLMLLVGIGGHFAVIIVTCCNKEMKSTSSAYFVSLSVAHLLMLATAALPEIIRYHIPHSAMDTTNILWSSIMFVQNMCSIATIFSMTLLSIERCVTWCCYRTPQCVRSFMLRRTSSAIATIWLVSFVFAAPWIHFLVYFDRRNHQLTSESAEHNEDVADALEALEQRMQFILSGVDALTWYVIPLGLMTANYVIIYRRIADKSAEVQDSQTNMNLTQLCFVSDSWMKTRASLKKSRCQLAKTLCVLGVTYALCWLPFRIWVICNAVGTAQELNQLDPWLTMFVRLLIYGNAAATPLIYCYFSYKFRRAFKLLLVKLTDVLLTHCPLRRKLKANFKDSVMPGTSESPDIANDHVELAAHNSISDVSDHAAVKPQNSNESTHISTSSVSRMQKY